MPINLRSGDYKIIGLAVLVAATSLAISIKYFSRAFPEATLDLRVDRAGSARIAQSFLEARGARLEGYRHSGIFDYNDETKLYLERTQGLARMDELTRGPIHLWRWSHRWFKPQQKEEYRAEVTPTGEAVGFEHEIPEDQTGANLEAAAARSIAESFLGDVMKRNTGDLEFVEAESEKRKARTDHVFTWKQKRVNLGDGSLRLQVEVYGDQVGGYREFVKIPEQWSRDYERLRSRNLSAQIVDQVLWVLLTVAMGAILILRLRDRDVPIKLSLAFGAVATVLYFLGQLNTFGLEEFSYRTTDSYSSFVSGYLLESLLASVGLGIGIFLLVASSEPMYREGFPNLPSIRRTLSWNGIRSRSFFMANVVGITLTFFFFAYQAVFYLLANRLGAWAPADVNFSNELNTRIPWVGVLFMGFMPAVSEELQFRAFAVPFLRKWLRSLPLAVVLAAFNWGFLHSAYPNEPFYIRGVEVGIGGVIIGLIMLRFGVVATLIWHYSVDALYTAFLLLRSPHPYLMISGGVTAGIMLVPLLLALIAYWRTGTFTDESALTNASVGVSRPERKETVTELTALSYKPLDRSALVLAGFLTLVFAAAALIPVYRFGQGIKVGVTRQDAVRRADQFLGHQGVQYGSFMRVAWLQPNVDPQALRYLLERRSVQETDRLYRSATRLLLWHVRYFRPLQKDEYLVHIDASNGTVFGYSRVLDENAPGASISPDAARALAEKAIAEHGYSISAFELQESRSQQRKGRKDYTLVWQAKSGDPRNVGEALYRLQVDIAGDQVIRFSRYFKLPEQWLRHEEASRLINSALFGLRVLVGGVLIGAVVLLFVTQVRQGNIAWRPAVMVGAAFALLMALSELNQLPVAYEPYSTSLPLATFRLFLAVSYIIGPLVAGLVLWLLVGLATSLYPDAWQVFRAQARQLWRRDVLVAIIVSVAASAATNRVLAFWSSHFHAYTGIEFGGMATLFDGSWPGPASFLSGLQGALGAALLAVLVIFVIRYARTTGAWWLWLSGLLLLAGLGPTSAHSFAEYAVGWTMHFIPLAITVGIMAAFLRGNAAAYLGTAFAVAIMQPLVTLFAQPPAFYRWNGIILAVLALLFLGWLIAPWKKPAAVDSSQPNPSEANI
jgi:membrane protease YdiL (CAAX protease family)